MDEATREIIGRSLMASSSSGLVPGNVASGHSPQQNATVNQLQQNQVNMLGFIDEFEDKILRG